MRLIGILILVVWVAPLRASEPALLDRYWIVQELFLPPQLPCAEDEPCGTPQDYSIAPFVGGSRDRVRRIYSQLSAAQRAADQTHPHPDQPAICAARAAQQAGVAGVAIPEGWDPERLELSAKFEGLRGLTAIHVDLSGLAAPVGWDAPFGEDLQAWVVARFEQEGLRLLSKEDVDHHPGQPKMAVFLSHTNPDTGCWWSVFSSVTETAVLTRDLNVKLRAGIWSQSAGFSADNPEQAEFEAVLMILEKFLADWRMANADEFEVTNVPPYRWAEDGTLIPNDDS